MNGMAGFLRLCVLVLGLISVAGPAGAAESQQPGGRLRIQLTAFQQATISSEISAKIDTLPYREGDAFKQGAVLVQFDCSFLNAQLQKAEATAEAARSLLAVNKKLAELDSISTLELEQSVAKVKETEAEVAAMKVSVAKCTLTAPYSGRVAKLYTDPHQYLTPGKPIVDILNTSHLEVRMIVPSRWLGWLHVGTRFAVQIEELGGRSYSAEVTRLGARIDPLSQTTTLAGEIVGAHAELLPGMSGWASFGAGKRK